VIAVPVPPLEAFVRARTAHYDASFVAADPGFVHAHVTLLGPWLDDPSEEDLALVGKVLGVTGPFTATFAEVAVFPDGLVHVRPEPSGVFARLTAELAAAFPQCPPYAGAYPDPVPHVTLDRVSQAVSVESVRGELTGVLPAALEVERVDLQWWGNHDCRLLHSWELG
jgi:2'-5' RNA ligase